MSLAVSLAVAATASGSWLAVVGVPTFGLEAAEEFGIPLERVVGVDLGRHRQCRRALGRARRRHVRRLRGRHHQGAATSQRRPRPAGPGAHAGARGGDDHARLATDPFSVDVELHAGEPHWEGVAAGSGYLRGRRVAVSSSGRRVPRPRQVSLWLPGADGTVARRRARTPRSSPRPPHAG